MSKKTNRPKNIQPRNYTRLSATCPPVSAKSATKMSKKQFADLQAAWYQKLADSGFKDIEWTDHKTGYGQNSYVKPENRRVLKPETFTAKQYYYAMADAYLAHNTRLKGVDRFLFKMHADGATYQEISDAHTIKYNRYMSIYTVYYRIKSIAEKCAAWNKTSKHGCRLE
jgi:hypothetical protein